MERIERMERTRREETKPTPLREKANQIQELLEERARLIDISKESTKEYHP